MTHDQTRAFAEANAIELSHHCDEDAPECVCSESKLKNDFRSGDEYPGRHQAGLLLVVGLVMTGHAVLTPLLMVVLMIIGDFLAMSLTTDNVTPSPVPNVWRIGNLTAAGVAFGLLLLAFCSAVIAFGFFRLHLAANVLQTLAFVAVAFGSQGTIYAIRERRHRWFLPPSRLMVLSSVCDVSASALLAGFGVLMAPLAWGAIGSVFIASVLFGIVLDLIKVALFMRLQLT